MHEHEECRWLSHTQIGEVKVLFSACTELRWRRQLCEESQTCCPRQSSLSADFATTSQLQDCENRHRKQTNAMKTRRLWEERTVSRWRSSVFAKEMSHRRCSKLSSPPQVPPQWTSLLSTAQSRKLVESLEPPNWWKELVMSTVCGNPVQQAALQSGFAQPEHCVGSTGVWEVVSVLILCASPCGPPLNCDWL